MKTILTFLPPSSSRSGNVEYKGTCIEENPYIFNPFDYWAFCRPLVPHGQLYPSHSQVWNNSIRRVWMWNTAVTCVPNCENCTRAVSELLYHNELSPHRLRSSSRRRRRRFCGDKKYRRQTGTVKGNYEPNHMVVWEYQWQRRRVLRSPHPTTWRYLTADLVYVALLVCLCLSIFFVVQRAAIDGRRHTDGKWREDKWSLLETQVLGEMTDRS